MRSNPKCAHCSKDHLTTAHKCNIKDCAECNKKTGRICRNSAPTLKCPNCGEGHSAKSDSCSKKKEAVRKARAKPSLAEPAAASQASGANATPVEPNRETFNQRPEAGAMLRDPRRPRLLASKEAPTVDQDMNGDGADDAMTDATDLESPTLSVPATPAADEVL
jgi:hypothetical protein